MDVEIPEWLLILYLEQVRRGVRRNILKRKVTFFWAADMDGT